MDGIEEDGGYSDDDLDALPLDDFQELQQDAIRSTQQTGGFRQNKLLGSYEHIENNGRAQGFEKGHVNHHGNKHPHQPSSDYGDFDDEMLDGEIFEVVEEPSILPEESQTLRVPGHGIQLEQWTQQGYRDPSTGAGLQHLQRNALHRPDQSFRQHGQLESIHMARIREQPSQTQSQPAAPPADVQDLQARINEVRLVS